LSVRGLLPFVVPLCGDQGPTLHGGFAEGRLFQDGFAAGVDQPRADFEVFGPGWDQAPAGDEQAPVNDALVQPLGADRNVLCWSHAPAWGRRAALDLLGIKSGEKVAGSL